MNQYELERRFDVKCYYHLFYRCVRQYDIYKLLKNNLPIKTHGSHLASIYLNSGFNIFESSIKEEKYRFTQIEQKTKQFVNVTFLPIVKEEKQNRHNTNNLNTKGIYNLSTGEMVKPHNGTYYVDDFR